ncbi:helix-turn-helix domain-containing protein [Vibrio hepatarius]|jgi:transcriptional regulator with XRE-family HTH domain|uniref:Transcriptional regulator n=1 Tax=Vibrio hepatarius TaxID=171383 RepID=A0A0M0I425_9VIBR|nr:helix-turn-helix transcriptional regulator [Vibrio hepatarius]KOO09066.1 transcriptional regulator [Vibrio hepatarius]NOI13944.1 helix-turn-helix transcriptional regulator [Vibrio hepatarius]
MNSPLPSRLRYIRKLQGITQQELGIKLGMDQAGASARISQYETGKHAPDYATVKRISEALNTPVAYFYCEDDIIANIVIEVSSHNLTTKLEILNLIESYQN